MRWPNYILKRDSEILVYTNNDEWKYDASSDNPVDTVTRGMSAEVMRSSNYVRDPEFLGTKRFRFDPSTEVVNNIKLDIATKDPENSNKSLAASATEWTMELPRN